MTREERALQTLMDYRQSWVIGDKLLRQIHVEAMLAFADAEAAAMRERAAGVVDEDRRMTNDPEVKGDLFELATAIRALPTTEVGNG